MDFTVVDKTKWESLTPVAPTKPADKYAPLLDALEAGEIIQIKTTDNKEAKGIRISIGRKSSARGFKVDYRMDGSTIYVRKSDKSASTETKKEKAGKS